jgi:biotin carboxylase
MEPIGDGEDPAKPRGLSEADQTILVICPTHRDHRELPLLSPPGINYLFHDYASTSLEDLICSGNGEGLAADPLDEIDAILAKVAGVKLAAVISTDDYPGSALAAIIAEKLGLPGPSPKAVLICQHKYLSRLAQAKLAPEAVPSFALIDVGHGASLPDDLRFPIFVKPVKSFFSIGAEKVSSALELAALFPRWASLDQFFLPLDRMLERYTGATIGTKRLIAEGLLKGEQVTVEGYAYGGKAGIFGVVDSVMFPGTLAFSRFDYPSSLPDDVQARMEEIAARVIEGMGFDHGLFNIEMMYDAEADCVSIIEINPRMASQFADLYEKVDGTSSYTVLLDIAQGRAPRVMRRQGRYGFAASMVLRSFEDYMVAALPSEADIERLALAYPDIRVELHGTVGCKLSAELQDGRSYRYGIVNLGGSDRADVLAQYETCRDRLGIVLQPRIDRPLEAPVLAAAPEIAQLGA